MARLVEQLEETLGHTIEKMAYELVGIEFTQQGKYSVLRVYIDSESGVRVDDCREVSEQISAILDVTDLISHQYTLEVSSPGIERPLFKMMHYQRFLGRQIKMRLKHLIEGRRVLAGEISKVSVKTNQVELLSNMQKYNIDFDNIEKANLVVNL